MNIKQPIDLHHSYEVILVDLANLFGFEYTKIGSILNNKGKLQYRYIISDISYSQKFHLDEYISNGSVGSFDCARASVLYSLYACRYLIVTDIEYPTYDDWKKKYSLSIDHSLPIRWFPRLTFDCTNWKPMSITENKDKGDDFLDEGVERLQFLRIKLQTIKSKYI